MKKIFKALAITAASAALCVGVAATTGCNGGDGVYTGSYSYTNGYGANYGMVVEVTVKNNIITNVKDITNSDLTKQGGYVKSGYDAELGNLYEYKSSGVEWHTVSDGWSKYFLTAPWVLYYGGEVLGAGVTTDADGNAVDKASSYYRVAETDEATGVETVEYHKWDGKTVVDISYTKGGYGWSDANEATWNDHISWLLQQYKGKSVADVLDMTVYTAYGYSANDKKVMVPDSSIPGEPYEKGYNSELASSDFLITGSTQGSGRLLLAIQNALGK